MHLLSALYKYNLILLLYIKLSIEIVKKFKLITFFIQKFLFKAFYIFQIVHLEKKETEGKYFFLDI